MVRLWIDELPVEVPAGTSVLAAARLSGSDLPALCYREGHPPNAACMGCLVRIEGRAGTVPSCATEVAEGMQVACETADLRTLRRTALELLLSDHEGDCRAPCQNTCPARMDIPAMLCLAAAGRRRAALAVVKRDIALPATLGCVCPEVCERLCRRRQIDQPAAICRIKRFLAERDLRQAEPYVPPCAPPSGVRVAVVGSGPAGLAAAYHLLLAGHAAVLIEQRSVLGGRLRTEFSADQLPSGLLDAEIDGILRLGAAARCGAQLGRDVSLARLREDFAAVVLATGAEGGAALAREGIAVVQARAVVDPRTQQTNQPGIFAAGGAVRPNPLVVKSVAAGKEAARAATCFLRGASPPSVASAFQVHRQPVDDRQAAALRAVASEPRSEPAAWATADEAAVRRQAARCLQCGCAAVDSCLLRRYAEAYACEPRRFQGAKRAWSPCLEHRQFQLDPGKCIQCGICVQIAADLGEPIGLAFLGRGFDVRIGVPLDRGLDAALLRAGPACVDACPTGALARRIDDAAPAHVDAPSREA